MACQTWTVLSQEAEAMRLLSDAQATERTALVWPE